MPKSSTVYLKELIHSLHTGEIVYFKKYARRHCDKDAVYMHLFNSIKINDANDDVIFMAAAKITNRQRFAEHKLYLYNLILEALTAYHKNKRVDFEAKDMISKAIILMNKKLFGQAIKIIEQAKSLIYRYNINYVGNEVLALEATINLEIFTEPDIANYFKNTFKQYRQNTVCVNQLGNLLEIRYLVNTVYFKYGMLGLYADKATLDYCSEELNLINRDKLNRLAQIIYDNNTLDLLTFCREEFLYNAVFIKLKAIYDNNPALIQQHTHNYIFMLSHSISCYIAFGNLQEAENNLLQLKCLQGRNTFFEEHYFKNLIECNIFYFEQILLLKNGDLISVCNNAGNKMAHLCVVIKTLPARVQLRNYYLFALICFYCKKYNEALNWLDKVFSYGTNRLDLQLLARMYEIACHIELGNALLVSHKLIAIKRYCKKQLPLIQQVNCFVQIAKLLSNKGSINKDRRKSKYYEATLIACCKKEAVDKFGFDIAIYCVMKNRALDFNDAMDYYNCTIETQQLQVRNSVSL